MDPRQRTHLVNALMQEAHRMMVALEKAMAGDRSEERHPALHGTQPTQRHSSLEDEPKDWGTILKALTDMQTTLESIEHAERQRTAAGVPSASAYAGDGADTEDYPRV
jgi:hypothetical protein